MRGDIQPVANTPALPGLARQYLWPWFGAALLLFGGLATLVIAGKTALEERRYERDGRLAQGTVVGKELDSTRTRKSWGDVVYRFKTPDGREVEGREKVGVGLWEATREGQTVRVQYLQGDAASNRVLRSDDRILTWIGISVLGFLGAIIGGLGGFPLFKSVRGFRLEERLGHEGVPAAATVTGVVQSGWRLRQPLWVIRYRYTDDAGGTHEGRRESLSPDEAAGWKVGDTGTIRYDRWRPAASVWLGRL